MEKKLERRGMQAVKDLNHHDDHCSELLRFSSSSLHSMLLDMQQILLSFCFPACTICPTKEGGKALVTSTTTSCSFWYGSGAVYCIMLDLSHNSSRIATNSSMHLGNLSSSKPYRTPNWGRKSSEARKPVVFWKRDTDTDTDREYPFHYFQCL